MSDNEIRAMVGVLMLAASLVVGFSTYHACQSAWRFDAVKRGYAEFNGTSGKWQWKTPQVIVPANATPAVRLHKNEEDTSKIASAK